MYSDFDSHKLLLLCSQTFYRLCSLSIVLPCFNEDPLGISKQKDLHTVLQFSPVPRQNNCALKNTYWKQKLHHSPEYLFLQCFSEALLLKVIQFISCFQSKNIRYVIVYMCLTLLATPGNVEWCNVQERSAGQVENKLLDQVRVVWEGQVLPVWVEQSICVFITVGRYMYQYWYWTGCVGQRVCEWIGACALRRVSEWKVQPP